jgi:hypothetical protein
MLARNAWIGDANRTGRCRTVHCKLLYQLRYCYSVNLGAYDGITYLSYLNQQRLLDMARHLLLLYIGVRKPTYAFDLPYLASLEPTKLYRAAWLMRPEGRRPLPALVAGRAGIHFSGSGPGIPKVDCQPYRYIQQFKPGLLGTVTLSIDARVLTTVLEIHDRPDAQEGLSRNPAQES